MKTTIIICVITYAVLSFFFLKVFLYQRTLLKIERKYDICVRSVPGVYPLSYMIMRYISWARYAILIILFIKKWYIALLCLLVMMLFKMRFPEWDDKHIETLLVQLDKIKRQNLFPEIDNETYKSIEEAGRKALKELG